MPGQFRSKLNISRMQSDKEWSNVMYAKHRKAVENARSKLDIKPSPILISSFFKMAEIRNDHFSLYRILKENLNLLKKMNSIQRLKGFVDSRNTKASRLNRFTRVRNSNLNLNRIESDNFKFGCKLLLVKSSLDTRKGLRDELSKKPKGNDFVIPDQTMEKYETSIYPEDAHLLDKLLRPKIYFDLEVKGIRPLGRIKMQLFVEACPEVNLQLVKFCTFACLDKFKFIRIFPLLWIEAELVVDNNVMCAPKTDYCLHTVDHGSGAGILSFAKYFLNGFPKGLLNFVISFKPLSVLNGERVAFGKVIQGLRVLDCLQDYGTKNGKTKKDIIVTKCGIAS